MGFRISGIVREGLARSGLHSGARSTLVVLLVSEPTLVVVETT
jgi:hypothetical protein